MQRPGSTIFGSKLVKGSLLFNMTTSFRMVDSPACFIRQLSITLEAQHCKVNRVWYMAHVLVQVCHDISVTNIYLTSMMDGCKDVVIIIFFFQMFDMKDIGYIKFQAQNI